MSWWELLLIPLGFAVGAYGTIVGAGGGFVLVPVLLILYPDQDPATITAISLMVVLFNALSGSVAYARAGRVDYVTGVTFALATVPGAIVGALLVEAVPRRLFDLIFALLLFALAGYTLWGIGRAQAMRPPLRGRGVVTRVMPAGDEGATFQYSYNVWHGIAYSAGVGFISSLLGIGGGVIHVPVMITLLRIPVHVAVATSHFVLAVMSGTGTLVHLGTGTLAGENLVRAVLLSLGAVPGAQVGARIAARLRGSTIARLLMIALIVLGLRLLWSGLTG
jgi:uncharacterized membrane protein YfcA